VPCVLTVLNILLYLLCRVHKTISHMPHIYLENRAIPTMEEFCKETAGKKLDLILKLNADSGAGGQDKNSSFYWSVTINNTNDVLSK
jgi:hypothetical protein